MGSSKKKRAKATEKSPKLKLKAPNLSGIKLPGENIFKKLSPAAITGIILGALFAISMVIRIALPYDNVFHDGIVWFGGTDPWYHMRLIENLAQNFPHYIFFDPFTYFPFGSNIPWPPFYDMLIVMASKIISFGHPSAHMLEVVGAYTPPVLGSLTIIPVYLIGKKLFNRVAGIIAAALIIVLPGEFLHRSLLGFTDHHVAEALFSTTVILFLVLAIQKARERGITFAHLQNKDWPTIRRPLIYSLLAGIFLGLYLSTWVGGLMFVFIISIWIVIQFVIDHLRQKSTDYIAVIGFITMFIATIMFLPYSGTGNLTTVSRASLTIAMLAPVILSVISWYMTKKQWKPAYYPAALAGLGGILIGLFYAIDPSLLGSMLGKFSVFTPGVTGLTVLEVHPITLNIAWANFTTAFFIAFISFGLLIYRSIKEERAEVTLLLVWSLIMLFAVFGQRRFSYYYAINAALLTGYLSWRILDAAGWREILSKSGEMIREQLTKAERRRAQKNKIKTTHRSGGFMQPRGAWLKVIGAGIAIYFIAFFPCIGLPGMHAYTMVMGLPTKMTQPLAEGPMLIDQAWYDSLVWLGENSPEPFDNPDAYYQRYQAPPKGENYSYPDTAYGVMSWWDYGHWITRIAHRIPYANPFQQGAVGAGKFFTNQNITEFSSILDDLGSEYIIIDQSMALSKFYAMATWAGNNQSDFFDIYYYAPEGETQYQPVQLYYPSYYRSAVVRLYNFDAHNVTPDYVPVIAWQKMLSQEGIWFKAITDTQTFDSYAEAEAYIASQETGNYQIVSADPFITPIPLEELQDYQLVYNSSQMLQDKPEIKIFTYTGK
ncbi:MAG: oligosaccharyl transferase, archaeosortase A system-associated [Dehalococcoidia bacterium]|nr:oligosaccharyl transferase, archaeosortase A system-associated [Dehalococcoidia bacterium]